MLHLYGSYEAPIDFHIIVDSYIENQSTASLSYILIKQTDEHHACARTH